MDQSIDPFYGHLRPQLNRVERDDKPYAFKGYDTLCIVQNACLPQSFCSNFLDPLVSCAIGWPVVPRPSEVWNLSGHTHQVQPGGTGALIHKTRLPAHLTASAHMTFSRLPPNAQKFY